MLVIFGTDGLALYFLVISAKEGLFILKRCFGIIVGFHDKVSKISSL